MISTSLNPNLKKLIATLNNQGLTGTEIAEVIWLASRVHQKKDESVIDVVAEIILEDTEKAEDNQEPEPPIADPSPPPTVHENQAEIVSPPAETPTFELLTNFKPIAVPDASAIAQPLHLARALRLLAREIAVGLPAVLDETATVESIAETGVWHPILKPKSELWLDVALVFDRSPSMCLWQRLGFDLYRLLSRYGEFRDVRLWFLDTNDHQVQLKSRSKRTCKPTELLTGDHRRLVVIVSDCVGSGWHNGQIRELIEVWTERLPTVVFQVFPERLWSRTAIARSTTVEFQGKQAGIPSNQLKPFVRSYWDQGRLAKGIRSHCVRLPVVPLEVDPLRRWTRVVIGDRRERVLGIVWDAEPALPQPSVTLIQQSLKERIDAFIMLASPTARELAALLTSAPVITLPITRLIRRSMLSQARAVHFAEVFMSGLLKVSGDLVPNFKDAERIAYELVDEQVRERLRSSIRDTVNVINQVSQYVARGLGRSVQEFKALLKLPGQGENPSETRFLQAFARVTASILRGLGGEFEAIADQLTSPEALPSQSIGEPELLTYDFTETWIELDPLERFEFEVGEFSYHFDSNIYVNPVDKPRWILTKSSSHGWQRVEDLGNGIILEMVEIQGGLFLMGSSSDEPEQRDFEGPQHEVTLLDFFIGKYPVTQAQWRAVAQMPKVDRDLALDPSRYKGDDRPVERFSWYDAMEFCARLSRATEWEYRLPTEAEWEYACRAGTTTPFCFGETLTTEVANYDGSSYGSGPKGESVGETTPVGSYRVANEWGLYDMHGNVWEWCLDHWHSSYEYKPDHLKKNGNDPWISDTERSTRVLRGGSYFSGPKSCRSAYRYFSNPGGRLIIFNHGFRVVSGSARTLQ